MLINYGHYYIMRTFALFTMTTQCEKERIYKTLFQGRYLYVTCDCFVANIYKEKLKGEYAV